MLGVSTKLCWPYLYFRLLLSILFWYHKSVFEYNVMFELLSSERRGKFNVGNVILLLIKFVIAVEELATV